MNRRSFLSLAPLILVPEPRRAYSFIWEQETEYRRVMRLTQLAIRDALESHVGSRLHFGAGSVASMVEQAVLHGGKLALPSWVPRVTVKPDAFFLETKTMRVRVEWTPPSPWMYA